jgi:cation diffusion facilitator CzcD-associated flavoprotein CzcO
VCEFRDVKDWQANCPSRYWNRYPGARVDSTIPHYEFSDPDLFTEWKWSQRFPGSAELRKYFEYVATKWNLIDDTEFSTLVTGAVWDESSARWTIYTKSDTNTVYRCQFFLPNTGFAAKRHIPDWKGIDTFQGTWIHPSYWPKEEPDLRGKKIAVIGTGSTGIQLAQELAPLASEFVLFQRTPNLALPMKQVQYDTHDAQAVPREQYPELFKGRSQSYGGFDFNFLNKNTFDDSEEDRRRTYEDLWSHGDFHYWLATYQDMLSDDRANTEAYEFW